MKKFLLAIFAAGAVLVCLHKASAPVQAWPIGTPYRIIVDTWAVNSLTVSTTNFPSGAPSINANVAQDQWCLTHMVISAPDIAAQVTIAWSTSTLSARTTDYFMVTHQAGIPYDTQWGNTSPYCAPIGYPILTVTVSSGTTLGSVSGSTITLEGFLWNGENP